MRDFLTSEEIAEKMGCTRAHVSRLAKMGRIPAMRRGRLIVVPRLAWEAFIAGQSQTALSNVEGASCAA